MREAKPSAQGKKATRRMRAVEDERIDATKARIAAGNRATKARIAAGNRATKARIAAGNRATNQTLCLLAYADKRSEFLPKFRITFAHIKLEQHLNLRNRGIGQNPL